MADIACIVEGHGEREAVPLLLRRIAEKLDPGITIRVPPPIRTPKSRLLKPKEIERAVDLAARKVGAQGAVLVILDSDDDCPAQLGPELLKRAISSRSDLPISVILAKREFESWFLAAAESLRGKRRLSPSLVSPENPEALRGAKEWLTRHMQSERPYSESLDQPALTALFDLDAARRSDSFQKCFRDITRLLTRLRETGGAGSNKDSS